MTRISCITLLILLLSAFGSAAQQSKPSSGDAALDLQLDAGFSAYARGQNAEARRTFESVRTALDPLEVPRLELAVALNMLMAIETREDAGRRTTEWYQRLDRDVNRVVEIIETTLGPTHPDFVRTLDIAAGLYGLDDKGKAIQERWFSLLVQTLGPNHPKVATNRLLEQVSRFEAPDPEGARSLAQQAVTLQETLGDQPEIATALLSLTLHFESKKEALRFVQRALAIRRAVPRQPCLEDIRTLGSFIDLQAELGQPLDPALLAETVGHRERALRQPSVALSRPYYLRSLEALEQATGPISLKNMALRGVIYVGRPRTFAHGEAMLNLALAAFATGFGRESPIVLEWLRDLPKMYRDLGRDDQARQLEAQAQAIERQRSDLPRAKPEASSSPFARVLMNSNDDS